MVTNSIPLVLILYLTFRLNAKDKIFIHTTEFEAYILYILKIK